MELLKIKHNRLNSIERYFDDLFKKFVLIHVKEHRECMCYFIGDNVIVIYNIFTHKLIYDDSIYFYMPNVMELSVSDEFVRKYIGDFICMRVDEVTLLNLRKYSPSTINALW